MISYLGADHPHIETLTELAPALMLRQIVLLRTPIDPDEFTNRIIEVIDRTV